jgi:putative ABC transport system permease protein
VSLWRQVRRGLRALANRPAADLDIADEVEHYLDEAAASLQAGGLSPEEARRLATLELGNAARVREQVRESGWEHIVETTILDLRFGARRLRRDPMVTAVAALTLALGIGASTAIFSAVNPVLFEPLPYPEAGRLMRIWDGEGGNRGDVTFGTYRELLERSRSFAAMTVMRPVQPTLTGVDVPERLDGQYVSADYFQVLNVRPALGRDFRPADDQPNAPFVVLISDTLWRRRFGADRAIVGRQISFGGTPVTVIGVLPAAFENVLSPTAEIWSPLSYDSTLPLNGREWGHHLQMVARLRPGVTPDDASRELDAIARSSLVAFPRAPWASLPDGFIATNLQDDLTRTTKPALLALLGAVALLLIIACVNVTNLLLARATERETEFTVRAALGASRWRLTRQWLAETLLLAGLGGALGILVAHAAVDVLIAYTPQDLPRAGAIDVDGSALALALGLTVLVGLLTGGIPALRGRSRSLRAGGPQQSSTQVATGGLTRRALVVVQVAFALVLLVGAGLLVRSLQHLFAVPSGFDAQHVLTMQVQTSGQRFREGGVRDQFFDAALDAVRQVPGVSGAAFTSQLPLTGDEDVWGVHFESVPVRAAEETRDAYRYAVSAGYFEAMGIRLRRGRSLEADDSASAAPAAVVNESFARRRLPGVDPLGQRLRIGPADSGPWFTIVGVAADVKQQSLAMTRSDAVYITSAQWTRPTDTARWLVVRAQGDAASLTAPVRRAIQSVDRNQPILRIATMEDRLLASAAERRFALVLFEAFGIVALALAAIGTYSLLSSSVTERVREIGVRSALGASRRSVVLLVLRQGMTLAGLGILIGAAAATMASRSVETLLFGVSRLDSTTYLGVVGLLAGVSAIACAVPAIRAAQIRPSIALKLQ